MAISVVAHGVGGSVNNNTVTVTINSSGCGLILVGVSELDGAAVACSVADNKGNGAYTGLTAHPLTASVSSRIFYLLNPTGVGASHNITATGTAGFPAMTVLAMVGDAGSSAYDSSENGNTGTVSGIRAGSVTPAGSNSLIVEHIGWVGAIAAITLDQSFVISDQQDYIAATSFGIAMAWLQQATAGNPEWLTGVGNRDLAVSSAAFTVGVATGGGGGGAFAATHYYGTTGVNNV